MKKLILILTFTSLGFSQSQKPKFDFLEATALQVGYANFGKNYGYIGLDKRIDDQRDWIYVNVGAGTYISKFDDKMQFIPEIHINYTAMIIMGEISLTNKAVNPSLGINVMNGLKLKIGYNFPFNQNNFKGTTFFLNINIGEKDYHHLPSMKFF